MIWQWAFASPRVVGALLLIGRGLFWVLAAVLAYMLCRRGLTLADEGYLLQQAADVVAGKVLYRDLDLFVTPGIWYVVAALFSVFGPGVLVTRLAAAACLLATMVVVRRIVRHAGGPLWGDFAAGLVAVFAVWAWPAWTFAFYSPWATLASLVALVCTLEWMSSRHRGWLLATGMALGLAISFKQNYGVFAAVGCALAVLCDGIADEPRPGASVRHVLRGFLRASLPVAVGCGLVLVPLVVWIAEQGALAAAFDSLVLRPFQGFAAAHSIRYLRFGDLWRGLQAWEMGGLIYMAVPMHTTAAVYRWPARAVDLLHTLHVLLYWIPVLAIAGFGMRGVLRLRRSPSRAERAQLATTMFAGVYFLGVLPRADYNHLINIYQPVLAMLASAAALHFGRGRWRKGRVRATAAAAAAGLLLCYAGIAAVWWNDLRKTLWIPLEAPRAEGILLEPLAAQSLDQEIMLLRERTGDDEPVFALPGLAMIPFLAERPMPTRYYNYYAVHIGHDAGRSAAEEIEKSGARFVLADENNFFADPVGMLSYGYELANYLNLNFRPELSVSGRARQLLRRRDALLDQGTWRMLWQDCRFPAGRRPSQRFVEHVLTRTVYHSYRGVEVPESEALLPCHVLVPTQARLRLALDLRQPVPAVEPVVVRAEVWALPTRGRPRRLLNQQWELASESSWFTPGPLEFDIDLGRYGGRPLTLLLRSQVEGIPPEASFDLHGLSVRWHNARLESFDEPASEERVQDSCEDDVEESPKPAPTRDSTEANPAESLLD